MPAQRVGHRPGRRQQHRRSPQHHEQLRGHRRPAPRLYQHRRRHLSRSAGGPARARITRVLTDYNTHRQHHDPRRPHVQPDDADVAQPRRRIRVARRQPRRQVMIRVVLDQERQDNRQRSPQPDPRQTHRLAHLRLEGAHQRRRRTHERPPSLRSARPALPARSARPVRPA